LRRSRVNSAIQFYNPIPQFNSSIQFNFQNSAESKSILEVLLAKFQMAIIGVNSTEFSAIIAYNVPTLCAVASFGTDYFLLKIIILAKEKRPA